MKVVPAARGVVRAPTREGTAAALPKAITPDLSGDVFLSQGALTIRGLQIEASPQTQLARAQKFLEVARAGLYAEAQPLPPHVEPATEVGSATYTELAFQVYWDAIQSGAPLPNPELMNFNDATVGKFVKDVFGEQVQSRYLGSAEAPYAGNLFRNFIRAAELKPEKLPRLIDAASIWSRPWPADDATAALLKRAAKAFKIDESEIPFNNSTLDQYKPQATEPVTTRGFDVMATLENYFISLKVARAFAEDGELLAGVKTYLGAAPLPEDLRVYVLHKLLEGRETVSRPPKEFKKAASANGVQPPVEDRRVKTGEVGQFITRTGSLSHKSTLSPSTYVKQHRHDSKSYFAIDATDENLLHGIAAAHEGWNLTGWESAKDSGRPATWADVIEFSARRLEIHPRRYEGLFLTQEALLDQNTTFVFGAEEQVIKALLRLAKAADTALDDVLVKTPNGVMTLRARAEELNLPRHEAPKTFSAAAKMKVFETGAASTAAGKLSSLELLLSTDPGAMRFDEVIAAVRELLAGGAMSRIEWAKLSEAQRARLLSVLTADRHLGAAAVLSGLFVDSLPPAALEQQLVSRGFGEAEAKTWGSSGAWVSALDAKMQLFLTEGLGERGANFAQFATRLSLAKLSTVTVQNLADVLAEANDAAQALRSIVDWAALRGNPTQKIVGDFIKNGVASSTLEPAELMAALADGRGAPYVQHELGELEGFIARVRDSEGSERDEAIAALVEGVKGIGTMARGEVAAAILGQLRTAELARVMPLDEADARLGGVRAKDWVDARSIAERLRPRVSRAIDLWGSIETVTSFDEVEGVSPMAFSLDAATVLYPRAHHALTTLKTRIELDAADAFNSKGLFTPKEHEVTQGALKILNAEMGPLLAGATDPQTKLAIYSAGRALFEDVRAWYEVLCLQYA